MRAGDLANHTLERELWHDQIGGLLIPSDLSEHNGARSITEDGRLGLELLGGRGFKHAHGCLRN